LKNKEKKQRKYSVQLKKFKDAKLQALLDENSLSTRRTLEE